MQSLEQSMCAYWQDGLFFLQVLKLLEIEVEVIVVSQRLHFLPLAEVTQPDASARQVSMEENRKHVDSIRLLSSQGLRDNEEDSVSPSRACSDSSGMLEVQLTKEEMTQFKRKPELPNTLNSDC